MLKRLKYIIYFVNVIVLASSIVLMLDFTASNPTGRRFSSEVIDLNLGFREKGLQGERIVARDLGLPANDREGRLCICRDPAQLPDAVACNSCLAYVDTLAQNRRPDFITDQFIVEVKNHDTLLYGAASRDILELQEYAMAALVLDIPLWLFVRTDTPTSDELREMIQSTGGEIVYYLRVPGHVDAVGRLAWQVFFVALVFLLLLLLNEFRNRRASKVAGKPESPASQSVIDTAGDFMKRSKDKSRQTIELEDSRSE